MAPNFHGCVLTQHPLQRRSWLKTNGLCNWDACEKESSATDLEKEVCGRATVRTVRELVHSGADRENEPPQPEGTKGPLRDPFLAFLTGKAARSGKVGPGTPCRKPEIGGQ
jgi:hypothetical protein